jgi:hypothetical protein
LNDKSCTYGILSMFDIIEITFLLYKYTIVPIFNWNFYEFNINIVQHVREFNIKFNIAKIFVVGKILELEEVGLCGHAF